MGFNSGFKGLIRILEETIMNQYLNERTKKKHKKTDNRSPNRESIPGNA